VWPWQLTPWVRLFNAEFGYFIMHFMLSHVSVFECRQMALRLAVCLALCNPCNADALTRMQPKQLEATHNAVEQFQLDRQPVSLKSGFDDVRTLLHIHSYLSHDSVGTPEEIRKAAVEAGARVVMFSNHPADDYDYIKDGHHDLKDGVLFIPGAEEKGLLVFPQHSVERRPQSTPQESVDQVLAADGQAWLSHLEERMDWELEGLTGTEIYNIHADFKDESRLLKSLRNPLTLMTVVSPAFLKYPQESFAALQDYPADYLRRWDELNPTHRLTGISANDAHQNTGVRAVVGEHGKLLVQDASGDTLATLDPSKLPLLLPLMTGRKIDDTVFRLQLDPYVRSFRHVSTHLLMRDFNEAAVREALDAGRAYVAFDWMCDPTGFVYQATDGDRVCQMGGDIPVTENLKLISEAPLNGTFKVICDGQEVHHSRGRSLEFDVDKPGIYRIEVWLNVAGESRIWILSNPIYAGQDR
jgi:hypothetical protein